MRDRLENTIVRDILKVLNRCKGSIWRKTHGSAISAGEPDIVGCAYGQKIVIEVKRPGSNNGPDPLQEYILSEYCKAGAITAVAYGSDQVGDLLLRARHRSEVGLRGEPNAIIVLPANGERARYRAT